MTLHYKPAENKKSESAAVAPAHSSQTKIVVMTAARLKRSTRRNRRQGFKPRRRGRPSRTTSGGSR